MTATAPPETPTPPARGRLARLLPPPGPGRMLVICSAVASVGNGLYLSGSAIYFIREVGLSSWQVGLGLSLVGLISLPINVPLGYLADRFGPREVTILTTLTKVVALIAAMFVANFPMYLLVVGVLGVADSGGQVARGALISGLMGREGRVALSAYLRSVFNAGFTLGVLGAGIVIAFDTRPAYLSLMLGNAAAMVLAAILYLRLPRVPGTRGEKKREGGGWLALRDWPYLAVAQVAGIARLGPTLAAVGLPVWLVTRTDAPRALAAWLYAINTLMVVLLQVRAARGADTVPGAARLQRWTFLGLAGACVVTGLASGAPPLLATAIMVVGMVVFTLGEIWGEGARWGLRYELAPDHAQGQYGGMFSTGDALAAIAGPTLVTVLPERFGLAGWIALAVIFLAGLAASGPVIRWAERTRPRFVTA
ncbi:MFS transporter [Sphaerisporangium siamense]|uniref:MFS family permease n=1 Tax=Sphaerisporangium siamense TaxID=795645 RepID=A0A7W7D927_9ACTN|nr:MFS transporter [Sphaerisporangium siamense]MBB4701645.1 MFS family permease [Sphaerisporangium siamense]GII85770.1 MFS transporter [Sphaerisporangium siamense]